MKLKEGNVAAVADFGMARTKNDSEDSSKTLQNVGPLKWMSPGKFLTENLLKFPLEAIKNQQYSKKSDVFSYGVVIWEIGSKFHRKFL